MIFGQMLITLHIFSDYFLSFSHIVIDPTSNDSHIEYFLKSPACHQHPYACQAKMKFE